VIDGIKVPLPTGSYVAGLRVDEADTVDESNETNNAVESPTVDIVGYTVSITVADTVAGAPFAVTVSVRNPAGAAVPGATVALSLEGPETVPEIPGPPGTLTPPNPMGVTNADGNVTFEGLSIAQAGRNYRVVAAVGIGDIGTLMFQSGPFKATAVP
jgi:hypothetical protein